MAVEPYSLPDKYIGVVDRKVALKVGSCMFFNFSLVYNLRGGGL
jgi:hypothetical protein